MPMDFLDLKSLLMAAEVHKFRVIKEGESEDDYRNALADHVASRDFLESQEIRNKIGWDQWSYDQINDTLRRSGMKSLITSKS